MRQSDRGSVLVIALIVVVFMGVLVAAFVSVTATELLIAANFRHTQGALAAGDAVAERAMIDLASMADWNQVLAGAIRSTFLDGSPLGTRVLPGGQVVSLPGIANLANCRLRTACSAAAMDAVTTARPRGPNNPRWQLYVYGRLEDVLPGVVVGLPYLRCGTRLATTLQRTTTTPFVTPLLSNRDRASSRFMLKSSDRAVFTRSSN